MTPPIQVYAYALVKRLTTIATIVLLDAFIGSTASAHFDLLGTPDPYWQRIASGSPAAGNDAPGAGGATHPDLLQAYVYVAIALLVLVVASSLLRSFWKKWSGRSTVLRRAAAPRTVDVVSPSLDGELVWLLNTAAFILVVVIYVVAFETVGSGRAGSVGPNDGLLPFQVLFRDLPSTDQRVFRAMQEGAGEAARLRVVDGAWPTTASLADGGIPPFARDPLDKADLHWSERSEQLVVNYLGVSPATGSAEAFLILIQEPDPVMGEKAPQPGVVDEEHQLLTDGTLLHVTYWKNAEPSVRAGVIGDPAMAGWTQIRVTSPFKEMEQWRDRLFRDS